MGKVFVVNHLVLWLELKHGEISYEDFLVAKKAAEIDESGLFWTVNF